MLMFTRLVTLTGSPRRSLPWATDMTAYVNAHSGLQVTLWSINFGRPIGTMAWTAAVESQTAFAAAGANLLADNGYLDLLEKGQEFVANPGEDLLREVVHGQAPVGGSAIGSVAQVTSAVANVDRTAEAMGWAVEIAQYLSGVAGSNISVLANVAGTIGEITWIGVQPDFAAVDTTRAKIATDAGYLSRIAGIKDLFISGSGRVSQATRIA